MQIIVNGVKKEVSDDGFFTYEELVELSGLKGTPTMTIIPADKKWRGEVGYPGQTYGLDEGDRVTVVHTSDA